MRRSVVVIFFALVPIGATLLGAREVDAAGTATTGCTITLSGAVDATVPCEVSYPSRTVTIGILADGGALRGPAAVPALRIQRAAVTDAAADAAVRNVGLQLVMAGEPKAGRVEVDDLLAAAVTSWPSIWNVRTRCPADGGGPCGLELTNVRTTSEVDGAVIQEWHGTLNATLRAAKTDAGPLILRATF